MPAKTSSILPAISYLVSMTTATLTSSEPRLPTLIDLAHETAVATLMSLLNEATTFKDRLQVAVALGRLKNERTAVARAAAQPKPPKSPKAPFNHDAYWAKVNAIFGEDMRTRNGPAPTPAPAPIAAPAPTPAPNNHASAVAPLGGSTPVPRVRRDADFSPEHFGSGSPSQPAPVPPSLADPGLLHSSRSSPAARLQSISGGISTHPPPAPYTHDGFHPAVFLPTPDYRPDAPPVARATPHARAPA